MPDITSPRPRPRRRRLRAALALSGLASLTLGLVMLPAAPRSLAAADSHSSHRGGSGVTVRGPKMWDPASMKANGFGKQYSHRSTVTVSQTRNLVHQAVRVTWTGFTPTNFQAQPYGPSLTIYPVMIAECKGTHPTIKQCYGADFQGNTAAFGTYGAFNTVYEGSSANGRGQAVIDVETISQNRGLGCASAHPCSLLIMPAEGGNKATGAPSTAPPFSCRYHGDDLSTSFSTGTANADFGGSYTSCSWAQRIVVPIRFAPTTSNCPASAATLTVAGSPMLGTAMSQWDAGLCSISQPMAVTDVSSVPEPEAITQVLGGLDDVALTTLPSTIGTTAATRHYAYAPVAVSAVAIGYWADNPNTGNPQTSLRLTPRLLAKLLTLSYDVDDVSCQTGAAKGCDPGIGGKNPFDMFLDPDFTKLNPRIIANFNADGFADVPIVMQGQSDMTFELTRWIKANAAAETFLHGTSDRWHMRVNKYYKGISYPAESFATNDPSPFMQAAFSPVTGLDNVASDLVLAAPPGDEYTRSCLPPCTFPRFSPEPEGQRALFSVLDSGDTAGFDVPVAAIPNHAGRYVRPTQASMAAALRSMVTAANGTTQQVNLNNASPAAYPLTMVTYAMVPTSGVSTTKAALIARWLRYVAGPGQDPGNLPGRLAPGYLPLPHNLRDQALTVATAVQNQTGGTSSSPTPTDSTSTTPVPSTSPSAAGSLSASASPSPSISLPRATPRLSTVAVRDPLSAGLTRYALPALLIIGGLAALGGASSLFVGSPGGAALMTRLRRALQARTKPGRSP